MTHRTLALLVAAMLIAVVAAAACAAPTATPGPTPTPTPTYTLRPTPTPTPTLYAPGQEKEFTEALAKHLGEIGAVAYLSDTCSYCQQEKALFGDALQYLNVVVCSGVPESKPNPQLCTQKGITAVPTWEMNGRMYTGFRTLGELAVLSGFQFQPAGQ